MSLKSADQIVSVNAKGDITFTVPQETRTIPIEELRQLCEQAEVGYQKTQDALDNAIRRRDESKAIYEAAVARRPQEAPAIEDV